MIKKHIIGSCTVAGLMFGAVLFATGMSVAPNSPLIRPIDWVLSPLIPILQLIRMPSHNPYAFLAAILCYWSMIGLIVGLCCKLLFGGKHNNAA
jgi:hypothetical protein